MSFEEYLLSKKINALAFKSADPEQWEKWQQEFSRIHPNSFTTRNLYLINPIRRKYPLREQQKI